MDSVRQGPQRIQGLRYLACHLVDQGTRRGGMDVDEPPSLLQLDREGRCEIRDRSDRGVVGAALEADLATGCVTEGDAHAEVEVVSTPRPLRHKLRDLVAQRASGPHRPERRVWDLDRVVEEELD